jgi:hypothetical protein
LLLIFLSRKTTNIPNTSSERVSWRVFKGSRNGTGSAMTGEADEHWLHDPVGNPPRLTNSDEEDVYKGGRDGDVFPI